MQEQETQTKHSEAGGLRIETSVRQTSLPTGAVRYAPMVFMLCPG